MLVKCSPYTLPKIKTINNRLAHGGLRISHCSMISNLENHTNQVIYHKVKILGCALTYNTKCASDHQFINREICIKHARIVGGQCSPLAALATGLWHPHIAIAGLLNPNFAEHQRASRFCLRP
jgi:hypothetical protein